MSLLWNRFVSALGILALILGFLAGCVAGALTLFCNLATFGGMRPSRRVGGHEKPRQHVNRQRRNRDFSSDGTCGKAEPIGVEKCGRCNSRPERLI